MPLPRYIHNNPANSVHSNDIDSARILDSRDDDLNFHENEYDSDEENPQSEDENYLEKPNPFYAQEINLLIKTIRAELSVQLLKGRMRWILDFAEYRISFEDLSFAFTMYVLFVPSLAFLFAPKSADDVFAVIMTICFSFFIFELVATTWSKTDFKIMQRSVPVEIRFCRCFINLGLPLFISWEGYFFTFFWFLDIIVIISLFPNIPAIAKALNIKNLGHVYVEAITIVRTLRLFRIMKAYKRIRAQRQYNVDRLEMVGKLAAGSIDITELEALETKRKFPSKLGEKLAESTTTRVIFLIVTLLVVSPLLVYNPVNQVFVYSTDMLQAINMDQSLSDTFKNTCVSLVISEMKHLSTPVLYLDIFPFTSNTTTAIVNNVDEINKLRNISVVSEYTSFHNTTMNLNVEYFTSFIFSRNEYLARQTEYFILMTIFSGIVVLVASFIFTRQTENYVMKPLERMMMIVESVARNPLAKWKFDRDTGFGSWEINLLEETFIKIAGLLRVCFGEAGAAIIRNTLTIDPLNPSSDIIDPMLSGIRMYCIIGFCDIHQFDFVLKMLAQDVLTFLNTIAAVVHERVHDWEGSCNKNLGNAFLIIWRIGDELSLIKSSLVQIGQANRSKKDLNTNMNKGLGTPKQSFSGSLSSLTAATAVGMRKHSKSSVNSVTAATTNTRSDDQILVQKSISSVEVVNDDDEDIAIGMTCSSIRSSYTDESDVDEKAPNFNFARAAASKLYIDKPKYNQVDLKRVPGVDKLAAKAMIGFLKIIADLTQSDAFANFSTDKRLDKDGGTFRVQMGFGLHAGWAIEGAVGSLQKVDVTYLSPHVNMAARLETASRQYGVPLLVSENVYELLSPSIQKFMRRLDIVTVKGSENAIGIYTYDTLVQVQKRKREGMATGSGCRLSISRQIIKNHAVAAAVADSLVNIGIHSGSYSSNTRSNSKNIIRRSSTSLRRSILSLQPNELLTAANDPDEVFAKDRDLVYLRSHLKGTTEFIDTFKKGVHKYISSDWLAARVYLEASDKMMKNNNIVKNENKGDGPSQTLLKYMASYNFIAPLDWQGFRPLTSK